MNSKTFALLVILFCITIACGTKKSVSILNHSTPLPPGTEVTIIGQGQVVPEGAKLLGHIKIGDSGFSTKCGYDKVIADAQTQSRAMGGNYLQIIKHKAPNHGSTCHRIECDVYHVK